MPPALFGSFSHWEVLIVLLIVLILFGSRLPGAMKSLGSSIREFKKGVKEGAGSPDDDARPQVRDDRDRDRRADEFPQPGERERDRERRS